ncbi:hypothetical protein [Cupriavidus sp. MP-37]|uniref:hypothetical protein n=1 Tax=Cupriavidus sp. MP-37 TaxID=2884455 RepID=UPI001D0B227A|nr:hypothetical protein [Cupriavidus sp. MP-37]UDM52671.1 hypothetical protein LIN44_26015 [Cupriavidus sp. MP-37]
MKKAMIGAMVMLVIGIEAQAATRNRDAYTDGAHTVEALQRSQAGRLVDEQFRKVAIRKPDPFVDGAVRQGDDPFADGVLASMGSADAFSQGA